MTEPQPELRRTVMEAREGSGPRKPKPMLSGEPWIHYGAFNRYQKRRSLFARLFARCQQLVHKIELAAAGMRDGPPSPALCLLPHASNASKHSAPAGMVLNLPPPSNTSYQIGALEAFAVLCQTSAISMISLLITKSNLEYTFLGTLVISASGPTQLFKCITYTCLAPRKPSQDLLVFLEMFGVDGDEVISAAVHLRKLSEPKTPHRSCRVPGLPTVSLYLNNFAPLRANFKSQMTHLLVGRMLILNFFQRMDWKKDDRRDFFFSPRSFFIAHGSIGDKPRGHLALYRFNDVGYPGATGVPLEPVSILEFPPAKSGTGSLVRIHAHAGAWIARVPAGLPFAFDNDHRFGYTGNLKRDIQKTVLVAIRGCVLQDVMEKVGRQAHTGNGVPWNLWILSYTQLGFLMPISTPVFVYTQFMGNALLYPTHTQCQVLAPTDSARTSPAISNNGTNSLAIVDDLYEIERETIEMPLHFYSLPLELREAETTDRTSQVDVLDVLFDEAQILKLQCRRKNFSEKIFLIDVFSVADEVMDEILVRCR
ncbi:hypothetical protein K488DRAFT_72567 [Vararia minispora EC-137]|uniref:Uncharacterized protein n=1 Tax=Vararia minispora EC-137 TaxID=1314806 RepID=A0ACB8QF83_9AGAM|nr:hypothetical protein K488DRAFT_72567 [Vararia minispora EC-137]